MNWLFLLFPLLLSWLLLTLINVWRARHIERRWNHVLREQDRWDSP
jgi:hypothetical protein